MANVLIIGTGGREHVLSWKLLQSKKVSQVFCAPGNYGMVKDGIEIVDINPDDMKSIADFVRSNAIDLTVVGPEAPLCNGIVDNFEISGLIKEHHYIFGPSRKAAKLEGSKAFAKSFMQKYGIPTAPFEIFSNHTDAKTYIEERKAPLVIKASGLAGGKGAIVCKTLVEQYEAIDRIMIKKEFKDAGNLVVIEDFMEGEEASILALTDGDIIRTLVSSQDHKSIYAGDQGPNTGGMGAYAPAPIVTNEVLSKVYNEILIPTIKGMKKEKTPFTGCLYTGLMIKDGNPRVVEFNVRFGDPETQPVLSLLNTDLYDLLYACSTKELHRLSVENKKGAACCVVMTAENYPGTPVKGDEIFGLEKATALSNIKVFHAGTRYKDGKFFTNGGRVVGVNGTGPTIEDAIKTAYSGVNKINWRGEYHRPDIGRKALKGIK